MNKLKQEHSAGVIPIRYQADLAEVLLVHQDNGYWSFPKGRVESDEDDLTAAKRELLEETGLEVKEWLDYPPLTMAYEMEWQGEKYDKTVTLFMALVSDHPVRIQAGEIQDYGWFPFASAQTKIEFPNAKQVLEEVERRLRPA